MNKPVHQVLIRPILTEKSFAATQMKKYVFEVAKSANKIEIAQAVETMFSAEKVKVASVNTLNMRGKARRVSAKRGRRPSVGSTPAWKKAIVTLTPDSPSIGMLEGA